MSECCMTREEAIEYLKRADITVGQTIKTRTAEALEMAIALLEQKPCDDCISRQYLLDNCVVDKVTMPYVPVSKIENAPPVTPQPKMGHWIAYEVRLPDRTILNYRCSVCGRKLIGYNTETLSEAPFCHCGAKMGREET